MRPPWLAAGSDSEEESSSEDEVESSSSTTSKAKIVADLTLNDSSLQKRVIGHQEDEKAIQRLISLSLERQQQQEKFDAQRAETLTKFLQADAGLTEKEAKAAEAADAAKLEALKAERKELFQAYYAQESQLAQDESGTTLQVVKEVEKVADKVSLREEGEKETVNSLMAWVKELKDEKKTEVDSSQSRVNSILRIVELREKAAQDYSSNKDKAAWQEAEKQVQQLTKEQKEKNDEIRKKIKSEVEKRLKEEEERQKQRQEAIKEFQKEQTKRSKGKKK